MDYFWVMMGADGTKKRVWGLRRSLAWRVGGCGGRGGIRVFIECHSDEMVLYMSMKVWKIGIQVQQVSSPLCNYCQTKNQSRWSNVG